MQQIYNPKQDYKVLVRCFTYNQSKYIEDTLNGFAMQQTDFPFVCLVMDDCSTDGEQDVIKAWMECECDMAKAEYVEIELSNVILVPHKSNANCTFAFYLLKKNLYGTGNKKMKHVYPWRDHCEYEAVCEGDDYWIHPQKIQMQAQWLDEHPDYSMCHGDFIPWDSDTDTKKPRLGILFGKANLVLYDDPKERFYAVLNDKYRILTLTTCFRVNLLNDYRSSITEEEHNMKFMMGDGQLYYYMSQKGHIKYFPEVVAVYNVHAGSASHGEGATALRFTLSCSEMAIFYCKKLGYDVPKKRKIKYNRAYINMLCYDRNYDFKYPPFDTGFWDKFLINQIKKDSWFCRIYLKSKPLRSRINQLRVRISMAIKIIYNFIS